MTTDENRVTTPFGAESTASDVLEGVDLLGKRMIVTGASSGIGIETARALAGAGAEVTLAVRDTDAGERAASDITQTTGSQSLRVAPLDLANRDSVAGFVASWEGPLHVLVNNAGIMMLPELTLSPEGWEMQFATNHVGHFELALGLRDALAAAGAEGGARIVSVSSSGHGASPVVFDDIDFARREYGPALAYGQSKTANALFAVGVTRRWASEGILSNSLMPGGIWTNLQRHWGAEFRAEQEEYARQNAVPMKTPEQGAATSVLLAASPLVEGVGGRYFEDCNEAEVVPEIQGIHGVRDYALDPAAADRLWEVSLGLLAASRTAG